MKFKKRQNFISIDKKTAIASLGEYFMVGETVRHQDDEAGEATILGFEIDEYMYEIKVHTDKGYAYLDFLIKINVDSNV